MQDRYYAGRHEDGSWTVFDRRSSVTRWNATYWDAVREAAHLNGKHAGARNAKCQLCKDGE